MKGLKIVLWCVIVLIGCATQTPKVTFDDKLTSKDYFLDFAVLDKLKLSGKITATMFSQVTEALLRSRTDFDAYMKLVKSDAPVRQSTHDAIQRALFGIKNMKQEIEASPEKADNNKLENYNDHLSNFSNALVVLEKDSLGAVTKNLIDNGNFADGTDYWKDPPHTEQKASATIKVENGAAKITVYNSGKLFNSVQFFQDIQTLIAGKSYLLTFTASSTQPGTIIFKIYQPYPDWNNVINGEFWQKINASPQTYTFRFLSNTSDPSRFCFYLGLFPGGSTITLSNISLVEAQTPF